MSWLFSQALVAEYSAATCSAGAPSAPLSVMPTPHKFWRNDKTMEPSQLSRFGLTCAVLTDDHGEGLLTWFLEGFHAKTSASQVMAPDLTANVPAYGQSSPASLAKYNPASHTLKTAQLSLIEDLTGCCVTLPRWGLMLDGALYQQPIAAPRTNGNESGLWQTPVADDAVNRAKGKWNSRGEPKLSAQVMQWPTPTVCGNNNAPKVGTARGTGLSTAVKTWPTATATATAYKGWSPNHNRASTDDRLDYTVERESYQPGQQTPPMRLNPDWVEWLMGWPIGWTELKPLEMDKFREWQQHHSPFLPLDLDQQPD